MAGPSQLRPPALPAKSQSGCRPVLQVDAFFFLFQLSVIPLMAFIFSSRVSVCVCVCYTKQKVAVVTLVDQSGAIDGPEMRKMRNVCETCCDVGLPLLVEGGNVSVPLVSCRFYSIVVQWGGGKGRVLWNQLPLF